MLFEQCSGCCYNWQTYWKLNIHYGQSWLIKQCSYLGLTITFSSKNATVTLAQYLLKDSLGLSFLAINTAGTCVVFFFPWFLPEFCSLTALLVAKDYPIFEALLSHTLSDNLSKNQGPCIDGWWVCFWHLIGISILHVHAWSPNATIKMLMSCEAHMILCCSTASTKVRCWYGIVNT